VGSSDRPDWPRWSAVVCELTFTGQGIRAGRVIRFQYRHGGSGGGCDPNYAGACLDPNSPDYDCEGGSGDGPDYTGRVEVVGDDHFDLDRDGDGVACE
jgi:hypothetical protein